MQVDPPDAEPPKRKRRWFQFRLRSLLIGVTLLAVVCGYVGWQAGIVRERRETMTELLRSHPVFGRIQWATISCESCHSTGQDGEHIPPPVDDEIPFVRRLLGDKPYRAFKIPRSYSPTEASRIRELFPEATIYWSIQPNRPESLAPAARARG